MKTYKLIKEYPGSPNLGTEWPEGTVAKGITGNESAEFETTERIDAPEYAEYWKEVKNLTNKEVLGKLQSIFFFKLEAKTGWGKNEVKDLFKDSVIETIE